MHYSDYEKLTKAEQKTYNDAALHHLVRDIRAIVTPHSTHTLRLCRQPLLKVSWSSLVSIARKNRKFLSLIKQYKNSRVYAIQQVY